MKGEPERSARLSQLLVLAEAISYAFPGVADQLRIQLRGRAISSHPFTTQGERLPLDYEQIDSVGLGHAFDLRRDHRDDNRRAHH